MQTPLVAIVILNWNGRKYLEKFLPSVFASTYPNFKVYVADNGSSDDSVSFVQQNFQAAELILLPENCGFAKGYNEALKQVPADYYILLNSDVQVTSGWIEPMVSLAQADGSIAACQPKILSYDRPQYFEYAGASGGWLDKYCYPFARGRIFDICEQDEGQYDSVQPIFWASGAALFIKASIFTETGGFDPYFFAHQEEIDLCWRIQLSGYRIMACPASVVYHVGGGTLPRGNSLKTYLNFRNNHIMMFKNLSGLRKWWVICIRAGLDSASAIKTLFNGDPGYVVSVASAHLSFVKWMLMEQKKSIFPKKKAIRPDGYWEGNVALEHFVKGKKKFSEIVKSGD